MTELVEKIRQCKGDLPIREDRATRLLYATDASIYYCEPAAVMFPQTREQLVEIVQIAAQEKIPLLPRGGGTSLSGQTVTDGLVIDLCKLDDIRIEGKTAYVGPGAVIDAIDNAAAKHGLRFGPAPASASRATIGGLLANNGTGVRSVLYGMAADCLLAAKVLFADGTIRQFTRGDLDRNDELSARVLTIADSIRDSSHWPKTWRNASGLNVRQIYQYNSLLPLFCGSEGSLGIIVEAQIALYPLPKNSQLALFCYDDLVEAMEAVPVLLKTNPSAIELMDERVIELARTSLQYNLKVIDNIPAAMLIVEYDDVDMSQQALDMGAQRVLIDPGLQQQLWQTRKQALGILMSVRSQRKPLPFIEDCAVPVEALPEYVTRLSAIIEAHGTTGAYYAHASAGCLHIRPLLNLRDAQDRQRMEAIMEECVDLVAELGGTLSGEHGDGRSKSPYLERIFGPTLVSAFAEIRRQFDPAGTFRSSGKARFRADIACREFSGMLHWDNGFSAEVEQCNGEATCRKRSGVMCPSFQVTGDELLSTRGRANLLRAYLAGEPVQDALDDTLAKCLACKACSAECPSRVDMASLKVEYQHQRGQTLKDRFFANFAFLSRLGRICGTPFSSIVKKIVGIHPQCTLPKSDKRGFMRRWQRRYDYSECEALLFVDTHIEYYEPQIGIAALQLCDALKLRVEPFFAGCCGRPAFSRGALKTAKSQLQKLHIPAEKPILVVEPSCLSMLSSDAPRLLPSFSWPVVAIEEFLLRYSDRLSPPAAKKKILIHSHCHHKASYKSAAVRRLLSLVTDVEELNVGCCGMAGSFGYDRSTYDLAMAIANDRFIPSLRGAQGQKIALTGRSCREMAQRHGIEVYHPLEIMAEHYSQI